MRGKGRIRWQKIVQSGITPAYAGKSELNVTPNRLLGDHPRLCGEKFLIPRIAASQLGSPPPMRGKEERSKHRKKGDRITPAYAGKSTIL